MGVTFLIFDGAGGDRTLPGLVLESARTPLGPVATGRTPATFMRPGSCRFAAHVCARSSVKSSFMGLLPPVSCVRAASARNTRASLIVHTGPAGAARQRLVAGNSEISPHPTGREGSAATSRGCSTPSTKQAATSAHPLELHALAGSAVDQASDLRGAVLAEFRMPAFPVALALVAPVCGERRHRPEGERVSKRALGPFVGLDAPAVAAVAANFGERAYGEGALLVDPSSGLLEEFAATPGASSS